MEFIIEDIFTRAHIRFVSISFLHVRAIRNIFDFKSFPTVCGSGIAVIVDVVNPAGVLVPPLSGEVYSRKVAFYVRTIIRK